MLQGADPGTLKAKSDPGFLDLIFANRTVLLFVRAALIMAAVYVLISVVALVVRRKWLIRAGPFEASEEDIRTLKEVAEYWQGEAFAQAQQVQELTERVEETDQLVENLINDLDPGEGGSTRAFLCRRLDRARVGATSSTAVCRVLHSYICSVSGENREHGDQHAAEQQRAATGR